MNDQEHAQNLQTQIDDLKTQAANATEPEKDGIMGKIQELENEKTQIESKLQGYEKDETAVENDVKSAEGELSSVEKDLHL